MIVRIYEYESVLFCAQFLYCRQKTSGLNFAVSWSNGKMHTRWTWDFNLHKKYQKEKFSFEGYIIQNKTGRCPIQLRIRTKFSNNFIKSRALTMQSMCMCHRSRHQYCRNRLKEKYQLSQIMLDIFAMKSLLFPVGSEAIWSHSISQK